jgi:hypothetical protein
MTTVDAARAFAYLLGELPEAEASQLDEAVLAEGETHELVAAFEAELFDAYLARELPGPRLARFEQRFLSTPAARERLRQAQALRRRAGAVVAEASPWWASVIALLKGPRLAVVGLVAAVVVALLVWPRTAPEARSSLRPDTVRASGDVRRLEVSATSPVVFELVLDDTPAASEWTVTLSGPGGVSWKGAPARADAVAAEVRVQGLSWVSGRYHLSLASPSETLSYDVDVVVR